MSHNPAALPGTSVRMLEASGSGQAYRIYIAAPAEAPPPSGFPVLYMLDANSSFLTMAQTMAVLSIWRERHRRGADGDRRHRLSDRAGIRWRQAGFRLHASSRCRAGLSSTMPIACLTRWAVPSGSWDFIEGDLKPQIAREYPIDPGRQSLFGHSFGGLFALHVLFTRAACFQTYVAASPSITWGEPAITAEEARFTADATHGPIRLLVTAGEYEQKLAPYERDSEQAAETEARLREFRMIDQARGLVDRLNGLEQPHLAATFRLFEGEVTCRWSPARPA